MRHHTSQSGIRLIQRHIASVTVGISYAPDEVAPPIQGQSVRYLLTVFMRNQLVGDKYYYVR